MTTLLLLTLRTSGVLVAALAAQAVCRRRSAALRHTFLAAGVAAALLVAPLTAVLPAWRILPAWSATRSAGAQLTATVGDARVTGGRPVPSVDGKVAAVSTATGLAPGRSGMYLRGAGRVAVGAWLVGVVAGFAFTIASLVRLARFSSAAVPVTDARWRSMADRVAAGLALSRPVQILSAPDAAIGTWGFFRPRVIVPDHALSWADERVRSVLCHELAHVSRGDWGLQIAAAVLRAAFWFNPLAWVACRRLRDEAERACDDVVLRLGIAESTYAGHLLDIARGSRGGARACAAAMSMARSSTLEGRVAAMLNTSVNRHVPSRHLRAAVVTGLVGLAGAAAALGVSAQSGPLSLHGSVYDSTGAVLPAVEMALTNDRGIKWTTSTDGEGRFEFNPVGPGEDELEAGAFPGFRPFKQKVKLDGPRDWNRVITLQVGTLEETVTLTAQRPKRLVAPSAPDGAARLRVGGNIKQPTKTRDVRPMYPESMRAQGLEGTVPLETLIGKDGKVISARIASAQVHPEFARAAIDAVAQWEFTPTLLNGVPVEVTMTASVSFRLVD